MKILVTGVSGYIGSNLIEYLSSRGYMVYGCCRTLLGRKDGKYIICDLVKELPDIEVDVIIHTAAMSPSKDVGFNDYFDNNVMATRNILKYAKDYCVKKIIYLGTVSSYGIVDCVLREDSPHNNPGDYGLTKYISEQLVRNSKIPYDILILPAVVGKGCRDNWIMKTAKMICDNKDFTYYNGEGFFNNILEIEDLCKFIEKLLLESEKSDTYLLGTGEKMTVREVITFLKGRLASDSQLKTTKESKNSFYLDISKALSVGFTSKSIIEILNEVCKEVLEGV